MHVRQGIAYRSWPLLSMLARLYRRTLARKTRVIAVVGLVRQVDDDAGHHCRA